MQTTDKVNNALLNHDANSILTESHTVAESGAMEFFQFGNRAQVCRLLHGFDQLGNLIVHSSVFDSTKVFGETALKYGLHRRFRRIRKTVSRFMGAEREPSLIA